MREKHCLGLLDPTSYIPLHVPSDEIPSLAREIGALLNAFGAKENLARLAFCEDTVNTILSQSEALNSKGTAYRQILRTLTIAARRHVMTLSDMAVKYEAEIIDLSPDVKKFSNDQLSEFASLAVSGCLNKTYHAAFVVANAHSLLSTEHSKIKTRYLTDSGDIQESHVDTVTKDADLLFKYQIYNPEILDDLVVKESPKLVWEKTGHQPSRFQVRVIERTAESSDVVIRSGTTYHNPNGSQKSEVFLRDKDDEIHFYVVDNGDVLGGIFKTKAKTPYEAQICLIRVRTAFARALDGR